MAVYDTAENGRTTMTRRTLESLLRTVNFERHELYVSDNGSVEETRDLYREFSERMPMRVIFNGGNLGTAKAINRAWLYREKGQHAVKMDNDVTIEEPGWLDRLEECIARDPHIGIIGLKRQDLAETPHAPANSWNHSVLEMLPHEAGERWLVVERVHHVMGTCQLYNSTLLDKIGFLVQDGLYGFDDALAAVRCQVAGFYSCFYPHVHIDHIDPGTTPYQKWKEGYAGERMQRFSQLREQFHMGKRRIYCGPDEVLS